MTASIEVVAGGLTMMMFEPLTMIKVGLVDDVLEVEVDDGFVGVVGLLLVGGKGGCSGGKPPPPPPPPPPKQPVNVSEVKSSSNDVINTWR